MKSPDQRSWPMPIRSTLVAAGAVLLVATGCTKSSQHESNPNNPEPTLERSKLYYAERGDQRTLKVRDEIKKFTRYIINESADSDSVWGHFSTTCPEQPVAADNGHDCVIKNDLTSAPNHLAVEVDPMIYGEQRVGDGGKIILTSHGTTYQAIWDIDMDPVITSIDGVGTLEAPTATAVQQLDGTVLAAFANVQ